MPRNAVLHLWKPVLGFEGFYEVSNQGQVRNARTGRVLRPGPSNFGHLSVVLGRGNTRMVHALVLEAFVGPRPKGKESCHFDGNPANNRLENLRWGTRSENNLDAVRHGTWGDRRKGSLMREYYRTFGRGA
jgi:hypothetical protein